jgi:hypothetical protein
MYGNVRRLAFGLYTFAFYSSTENLLENPDISSIAARFEMLREDSIPRGLDQQRTTVCDSLAYWRYEYDRHGAPLLDELAAAIGHVQAFSIEGPDIVDNLATASVRAPNR